MKTFTLQRRPAQPKASIEEALTRELNPQQLAAVRHRGGPALVVAGAGTGKTRVLTYRVAWLISQGSSPAEVLLLTFTRRAAAQMLTRAAQLMGPDCQRIEGGTFHAFANKTLRRYANLIGFDAAFTVLDEGDAEDTLDLLRSRHVTRARRFPRKGTIRSLFSHMTNRQRSLGDALRERYPQFAEHEAVLSTLHTEWTAHKKAHNLMDFDDLLLYLQALLETQPAVRAELRRAYKHILVDEFQDTNRVQGAIVDLLAGEVGDLMVVGDEAQSIYSFRGADVRNILDFPERFPGAVIYRLEENYRSTDKVLKVANAIIAGAKEGFGKALFTTREGGEAPLLVECPDAQAQAQFVAEQVLGFREQGVPLSEQAVLFRSARHAAELELELTRRGIPFRKFGGVRFFDAAHIKDVLAHLKVSQNPQDIVSWHRLLKLLPGVGGRTAEALAAKILEGVKPTALGTLGGPARAQEGLERLGRLFEVLTPGVATVGEQIQAVLSHYQPILEERFDNHPQRLRDIEQLMALADPYGSIEAFLTEMALEPPTAGGEETSPPEDDEMLTLTTIHSAKGLEWNAVFVLWAADGFFPSSYAEGDVDAMEEERRLMYVAVTRARSTLFLTYPILAQDRRSGRYLTSPSRFLSGLGEELLEPARLLQA